MDESSDNAPVSIQALSLSTRTKLSNLLNPIKIIPSEQKYPRYWKGLSDLCGLSTEFGGILQNEQDPTARILKLWHEKDPVGSTVAKLLSYIEQLERFDVIDDIAEDVREDLRKHEENPEALALEVPDPDFKQILTKDDRSRLSQGLPLEIYDAFVLFCDDDIQFATELINELEVQAEMKLLVKNRDLLYGKLEYDDIIQLILKRVNRVIVILSDAFFGSDNAANRFYLNFSQAYGIERQSKVIPCVYKDCNLPEEIRYFHILDFRQHYWNPWGKLRECLKVTSGPQSQLNRSKSDNTARSSASHHASTSTLKPNHHQVKFSSLSNLNTLEDESIIAEPSLVAASTSAIPDATLVKKNSLYKRLVSWTNSTKKQVKGTVDGKKKKKHSESKKKMAAVAN